MRILQVTSAYYPELQFGGPPQKIHGLSRALLQNGHEVRVVTHHSQQRGARHTAEYDGIPVQYIPWFGWGTWQFPRAGRPLHELIDWAEVVHCYGLYNLLVPMTTRQARHSGRSYVLEPMGMYVPIVQGLLKKRLYHSLLGRKLVAEAARIIATSEQEQQELIASDLPSARIVVRRNGIDLAEYAGLPDRGCFRQRFGLAPDEPLILFLSRLSPKKSPELLLEAFAHGEPQRARLVLAGPAEAGYERQLRQLAAQLNVAERVIFPGPLYGREKLEAFADADLFVLPSQNENFGNVIAEAIAAQVPVVITRQCGIAPYVADRTGLVIEHDRLQLRTALQSLLTDRALYDRFKANCASVAKEFSWDEPARQMEQLYRQITGERVNVKTLKR